MGVKQKTPTPFVGAGSVRTVTPDLTSNWSALKDSASLLLSQRMQERKDSAIEAGELAGQQMVDYDENGNLQTINSLPQGNTYYEQAQRNSAVITYTNSLNNDIQNFATKALQDNPFEPEIINEKMSIYRESALDDIAPELKGITQQIVNEFSNNAVTKARGNKILEDKRIRINENSAFATNVETTVIDQALLTGIDTLSGEKEKLLLQSYNNLNNDNQNGFTNLENETKLKALKSTIKVNQKLYKFNNLIEPYSGMSFDNLNDVEQANKFKEFTTKIFNFTSDTLKNLETVEEKELFEKKLNQSLDLFTKKENAISKAINAQHTENMTKNYNDAFTELQNYSNLTNGSEEKENLLQKYSWLLDPNSETYKTKIANKDYSPTHLITLRSQILAGEEIDKNAELALERSSVLTGLKTNVITLNDIYTQPEYTQLLNGHDSEKFKIALNDYMVTNYNNLESDLKKIRKDNIDMKKQQIISYLPELIHLPEGPFSYNTDSVETFDLLRAQFPFFKDTHINQIMNEKKILLASHNKERKLRAEIYDAKQNGSKLSDPALELLLQDNNITNADVVNQGPEAIIDQFKNINMEYNNWNTPLGEVIKSVNTQSENVLQNMVPVFDMFLNGGDDVKAFFIQDNGINSDTQKWIRDFMTELNSSDNSGNIQQAKSYANEQQILRNDPDKANRENKNFLNIFKEKKYVTSSIFNPNYVSMNNSPVLGGVIDPIASAAMKILPNATAYGIDTEEQIPEYINNVMSNLFDANEGFRPFIQELVGLGVLNKSRARELVEKYGDFDLKNMEIPPDAIDSAIRTMKKAYNLSPTIYDNDPAAVQALVLRSVFTELDNYVPHAQQLQAGKPENGHIMTWAKQSIVHDSNKTFGLYGAKADDRLIQAEIALSFNDPNYNKTEIYVPIGLVSEDDKKRGVLDEQQMFTPQDFGEDTFFDVRWVTRHIGKNENGDNEYQIGYVHGTEGTVYYLSAENNDGSRSPIIHNYNYENSYYSSFVNEIQEADRNSEVYKFFEDKLPGSGMILSQIKNKGIRTVLDDQKIMAGLPQGTMDVMYQWHYYKQEQQARGKNIKQWGEGTVIDLLQRARTNSVKLLKNTLKQDYRTGR